MSDTALILSAVAGLLTAIGGTYVAESIRRKNEAGAAKDLTDAAMSLLNANKAEHEEEQDALNDYIKYLLDGIEILVIQIKELGKEPKFLPKLLYKKD